MAIVVEYKLTGIELLTRSQVINAVKEALRRTGEYWFDAFLWKRFTPLGFTEYGFRSRSRKYESYKFKHRPAAAGVPLVLTGEGRDQAQSESTRHRIRATRDKVTIPLPTKFNLYNPKGPRMVDEVRHVTAAELRQLEGVLVQAINDELDKQVPAHLRNRGEIGGRVESLRLSPLRGGRGGNPADIRRKAA